MANRGNVLAALATLVMVVTAASHCEAQGPAPRPAFEVVSIKPNKRCEGRSGPGLSPGRVSFSCLSIRDLVRFAYGSATGGALSVSHVDVVGGPSWLDSNRYDIAATMAAKTSAAGLVPMVQAMLEERCSLKVHKDVRQSPVYDLVLDKGRVKPTPTKDSTCIPRDLNTYRGEPPKTDNAVPKYCGYGGLKMADPGVTVLDLHAFTMAEFASKILWGYLDRPVVEKTGLAGRFDLHLEFAFSQPGQTPSAAADALPMIFAALREQVGLRLVPATGPTEVIVIDQVEVPSEN